MPEATLLYTLCVLTQIINVVFDNVVLYQKETACNLLNTHPYFMFIFISPEAVLVKHAFSFRVLG